MSKWTQNMTKSVLDPAKVAINKDKKGGAAAAPAPAATVMPDADDEAVAAAKRRKMAEMQNRGGRASTVLGGEDRLGG